MSATTVGAYVYGIRTPLPPRGFPVGRLRWKIRSGDFARARVMTPTGIREFAVLEKDGCWVAAFELGRNHTA